MTNELTQAQANPPERAGAYGLALLESQPLDQNPALVYLAGLGSDHGRNVQRQALEVIAEILTGSRDLLRVNWAALRFQHTQAIRARLLELKSQRTGEPLAPATINRLLCALRGTLKAAWLLGQMSAEDYHKAASVKSVTASTILTGRALTSGELAALMAACENDSSSAGVRDAAIIALMYSCLLRRAELAGLALSDYDSEPGRLVVLGKRRKERTAYPNEGARRALADWQAIRGSDPGAMFWPITKGGKLQNRHMTTQAIYFLLAKRGAEAGIAHFTPHDLRRSGISDLLDAGGDLALAAELAGHKNTNTTKGYDRRPEAAKQKAAGLLHIPYRGRLVR